jgi:hypothetical protein
MRTAEQLIAELNAAAFASPAQLGVIATVSARVKKAIDAKADADATLAASTPAGRAAAFAEWDRSLLAWETFLVGISPGSPLNPSIHISEANLAAAKRRSDADHALAGKLVGYQFGDDPFGDLEASKKAAYLKLLDAQAQQVAAQAALDKQLITANAFADYLGLP